MIISKNGMNIEKISLKLRNLMKILEQKHSKPNEPAFELLLQGPTRPVHSIIYGIVD